MDAHVLLARTRHVSDGARIVGEAVLKNYPVRLWRRQQQHTEAVTREARVLDGGHEDGARHDERLNIPPPQLLADMLDLCATAFRPLIQQVNTARRQAVDAGLDRIDCRVPLVHRAPDLADDLRRVWDAVDDYCAWGYLRTPPRDSDVSALWNWTFDEISGQYYGATPTAWAGPF